jgi:hypothetical protein
MINVFSEAPALLLPPRDDALMKDVEEQDE